MSQANTPFDEYVHHYDARFLENRISSRVGGSSWRTCRPRAPTVFSTRSSAPSGRGMFRLSRMWPQPMPILRSSWAVPCGEPRGAEVLRSAGFVDLEFAQTLTRQPKHSNDSVEEPIDGFDRGD